MHECNLHIYRDGIINSIFPAPGGDREKERERNDHLTAEGPKSRTRKRLAITTSCQRRMVKLCAALSPSRMGAEEKALRKQQRKESTTEKGEGRRAEQKEEGRGSATSDLSGAQSGATKCWVACINGSSKETDNWYSYECTHEYTHTHTHMHTLYNWVEFKCSTQITRLIDAPAINTDHPINFLHYFPPFHSDPKDPNWWWLYKAQRMPAGRGDPTNDPQLY